MADSTNQHSETIIILYDLGGHILCSSAILPPYTIEELAGKPAWYLLAPHDALICQAAFHRCGESKTPQTYDQDIPAIGRWRITIHACRAGKVRFIGHARKFPESVLCLTDRQREICALLARGMTSREIAKHLELARETIDNHRSGIARRIGIKPWSLLAWCGEHREWL